MADCIFCKIISAEIPSDTVYTDEQLVAFRDTNPQAPTHIIIIPREHMDSLDDASERDERLVGHLLRIASKIANQMGLVNNGYRVVINTGPEAGQSVFHLHLHLLGGRPMQWPPG